MKSSTPTAAIINNYSLETVIPLFLLKNTGRFIVKALSAVGGFYLDNPTTLHHPHFSVNPWAHRASTPKACSNDTESLMDNSCPPLSS